MNALLLLLIVPVALVWFTPAGTLRRFGQNPMAKPAVVGIIVLAGWMLVSSLDSAEPRDAGYASGDTQIRALLD